MQKIEQIQVGVARDTLRLAELASGWPGAEGMRTANCTIDWSHLPTPYLRTVEQATPTTP
jgi:hypothetical protein